MKGKIKTLIEIFLVSAKLGVSSFGGPTAHIGYFRNEYVIKRKWLDDEQFADLLGIGQILPGPASSQVGIGIGVLRGGILGGIASFLGFTLPSVCLLVFFALFFEEKPLDSRWFHGFKLVAIAVVAHAVIGMWQQLMTDNFKKTVCLFSALIMLLFHSNVTQLLLLIIAGSTSYFFYKENNQVALHHDQKYSLSKRFGILSLSLFLLLIFLLPVLAKIFNSDYLLIFDKFYRSGSLVFGGGHVVLPLLETEFVSSEIISQDKFLTGYALTQAMPGPLFTFSSYIGAVIKGVSGALVATVAIFLPSFLLMFSALPFWSEVRNNKTLKKILPGINASVVGLLLATLYNPVWISGVTNYLDVLIVIFLFVLLRYFKVSPILIVILGGLSTIIYP